MKPRISHSQLKVSRGWMNKFIKRKYIKHDNYEANFYELFYTPDRI